MANRLPYVQYTGNHTPKHSFRIPDDLWEEVTKYAALEKCYVSDVVVAGLQEYVRKAKAAELAGKLARL